MSTARFQTGSGLQLHLQLLDHTDGSAVMHLPVGERAPVARDIAARGIQASEAADHSTRMFPLRLYLHEVPEVTPVAMDYSWGQRTQAMSGDDAPPCGASCGRPLLHLLSVGESMVKPALTSSTHKRMS